MIDSAARAERFDPAPSISPFYTWEVPQKPVLVRLPLLLIDRLEREAVENFRSVSSRGSEIGGVLWGGVDPEPEPGEPTALSVAEYDLVPCDYTRGPLYRLSDTDMARLDRALAQRGGSGLRPVGFFRSHTRKGLSLDADDLALMESRFPEPHQVALVIRPYATKASAAGIFIREGGAIHSEASYLEFPFRSAQLAPSKHLADAVDPAANTPAAPAAPKPVVRAQIVPIAPRREIAVVAPPLAAEAAPPPSAQPMAQPQPQPVAQPLPQPVAQPLPQPVAQPLPQPVAQPLPQPVAQPLPQPVAQPLPQPAAQPLPQPVAQPLSQPAVHPVAQRSAQAAAEARETTPAVEPPLAAVENGVEPEAPVEDTAIALPAAPARAHGGSKLIWFAVGAIFPLLLSGILFVYPGVFHRTTLTGGLTGKDTSPLALRVERTGSELLLTWNNDSSAIRNASRAVLSIVDGEQHENVDMDLAQLRNGRIEYLPVTGDVVFRMEVSGKDNAKTASESVRVLRTRPSPMPPDSQTPAAQNPAAKPPTPNGLPNASPNAPAGSNTAAPNTPAPNTAPPTTPSTETEPAAVAQPSPAAPLRPFNTASLSARLRPVASDDIALPDAPTVGGGQSVAASDAALKLAGVSPTALPPAPRKGDASSAPKQSPAITGGDVQTAQLIYRKNPEYPALARSAGAKGTVELLATIGANGRVKSVKVMKGHPLLQKAAVDAVMQWQYRPTMLNGHPVETETSITLNFVSDR